MLKNRPIITTLSFVISTVVLWSSAVAQARAISPPDAPAPLPTAPVLISEVQAGSATSASEEFIELYNAAPRPIDFSTHNWRLEIASSSATNWSTPLHTITLTGTLDSGQYYVVASKVSGTGALYLPALAQLWFSAGISAATGHVRLLYATNQIQNSTCAAVDTVEDELEWSAAKNGAPVTPSLDGRTVFMTATSSGLAAGSSLQRLIDPGANTYVDSNNDVNDFAVNPIPTPGANNTLGEASALPTANWQTPVPLPVDTCDPTTAAGSGQGNDTDTSQSGDTADGGQSSPPVSNTPPPDDGQPTTPSDPGSSNTPAPDPGDGTTTPPVVVDTPSLPAADEGLLSPELSEILPNPAPPQTDDSDEFIEVYNPNDAPYDLSGFVLTSGLTTLHAYTFPAGTTVPARGFAAYFSADTGLGLSNSGGQVTLDDPMATPVSQTAAYGTAKDGQAYIVVSGAWQWTTIPTPNAPNIFSSPVTAAEKVTAVTTTSKITAAKTSKATATSTKAVKGTSTTKPTTPKAVTPTTNTATLSTTPTTPIHLSVLAAVAAFALLYGAYEYRHDVANRLHNLRANREARREARASAKGRGGN